MEIRSEPPIPTRPCRYCLALQDDNVFADFDVDEKGHLYVVRISYDGYGCCKPEQEPRPGVIDKEASKLLIGLIEGNNLGSPEASTILRNYFRENQEALWSEALKEHGLI